MPATLLQDTSRSGACIRIERPIAIGSRITIKWHREQCENARIEEEMEKVRSHYADRIQTNLDQVAKEKDALRNWQMAMQHESQRIAEVIDLCGKQSAPAKPATALAAAAGVHRTEKP